MRARRACVAILLALAGVVGGCGVPDSGTPVVDSSVPPYGVGGPAEEPDPPPRPEYADNSADAVKFYFQAASAEPATLDAQVRRFLSSKGQAQLRPARPRRIHVVRIHTPWSSPKLRASNEYEVRVTGRVIGELTDTGILLPVSRGFSHTFKLQSGIVPDAEGKNVAAWLIDNPPPYFVLSDEALRERYTPFSLYFSNQRSTASLIADRRYLAESLDWKKQLSLRVDWLLQGPSPWLSSVAVRGFPSGTKRRGNVYVEDNGQVVVTLSREADASDRVDLMLAQLVWSLPLEQAAGLQLRIEDQLISYRGRTTQSRRWFNRFKAVADLEPDGAWYYINDKGQVSPLPPTTLPDVLTKEKAEGVNPNTSVAAAALSRSGDLVALVRNTKRGQRLVVGRLSTARGVSNYREVTGLPPGRLGRPVWLAGAGESVLLTVGQRLYRVELDDLRAHPVPLPAEVRKVGVVSMAVDGYRAALLSGGRLYVAVLARRGGDTGIESPRLVTDQIRNATDVAWGSEQTLVVAGQSPEARGLWDVDIDGLGVTPLHEPVSGQIPDQVAVYPGPDRWRRMLVVHDGHLYEVFSGQAKAPTGMGSPPPGGSPCFVFEPSF